MQDRDAVSLEQILDDRHSLADILWCLFTLGFVLRKSLAAEGRSMRVEGHADMGRFLFGEHLVQRVQESHNGTRIQTFRVDSWIFDERIIAAINERISV